MSISARASSVGSTTMALTAVPWPMWLARTRVRHTRTGARGWVVDEHPGEQRFYGVPLVAFDHGATMRIRGNDLGRSPDHNRVVPS